MTQQQRIAFIGGGNMASAPSSAVVAPEGFPVVHMDGRTLGRSPRATGADFGTSLPTPRATFCSQADMIVWAVKAPDVQGGRRGVAPCSTHAVHLSVMAAFPATALRAPPATSVSCAPCPIPRADRQA